MAGRQGESVCTGCGKQVSMWGHLCSGPFNRKIVPPQGGTGVIRSAPASAGWKCPGCGGCYAPFVPECARCRPKGDETKKEGGSGGD